MIEQLLRMICDQEAMVTPDDQLTGMIRNVVQSCELDESELEEEELDMIMAARKMPERPDN